MHVEECPAEDGDAKSIIVCNHLGTGCKVVSEGGVPATRLAVLGMRFPCSGYVVELSVAHVECKR